uniref:hypothetical protein n=1 Tax=Rhodococcus oryzae TaxID=2571143 RepID=UPI001FE7F127|nr:hypothetical protein [Rhodococcus oryzae]
MTAPWPPAPPTGPVAQDPRPAVPVDVGTAFQLLCGVAALGVVNLFATLAMVAADRKTFADQLIKDVHAQDPTVEISASAAEGLLLVGLGVTALLGLALTGLYLLFVFKMRSGRNWARMLVTMIGVTMVFFAIPALFGLGAGGGVAGMVAGGAGILQAVLSVGAVILMHRSESNQYFVPGPKAQ